MDYRKSNARALGQVGDGGILVGKEGEAFRLTFFDRFRLVGRWMCGNTGGQSERRNT